MEEQKENKEWEEQSYTKSTMQYAGSFTRKRVLIGFLFFAFFVIVIGILNVGFAIKGPFIKQVAQSRRTLDNLNFNKNSLLPKAEQEALEQEEQKNLDTDKDTLSDYDELYIYNTSPYLADTDSDGFDDNVEIASGNDPNCAPGATNCSAVTSVRPGVADTPIGVDQFLTNQDDVVNNSNLPVLALRQTLKDLGYQDEVIDNLSDDDVITLYNNEVASVAGVPQVNNNEIDLNSFSAQQIRSELLKRGIPESALSQISDADLKELFSQSVEASN